MRQRGVPGGGVDVHQEIASMPGHCKNGGGGMAAFMKGQDGKAGGKTLEKGLSRAGF